MLSQAVHGANTKAHEMKSLLTWFAFWPKKFSPHLISENYINHPEYNGKALKTLWVPNKINKSSHQMKKFYWAKDKNNANDFSSQYGKYNSWFNFIDLAFIALRWAVWELATFIITQWSFLLIEFAVISDPKYEPRQRLWLRRNC